jgi:hypothetical protein
MPPAALVVSAPKVEVPVPADCVIVVAEIELVETFAAFVIVKADTETAALNVILPVVVSVNACEPLTVLLVVIVPEPVVIVTPPFNVTALDVEKAELVVV